MLMSEFIIIVLIGIVIKEDVSAVLSSMTSSFFLNLIVFCEIKLLVVGMIMTPCIRMGYKVDL